MDNIAKSILKQKISSLKGTYFQDSLDKIFQIIYGSNFTQIKQKRDQGCDGIINGDIVIAAYAPEKYSLANFKKKVGEDFFLYEKNWVATHPNWKVVCNLEITSLMYKYIFSLMKEATTLCIDGLIEEIRALTWSKIFLIFESLDISIKYLTNDIFNIVIKDIISTSEQNKKSPAYSKPIYIEDKAHLNIQQCDIDTFLDEYEECLEHFTIIQETLKNHKSKDIMALRVKIRTTYQSLSGGFLERLKMLSEILAPDSINDDFYIYHVRIVTIYFFEQCLYGKKSKMELENA